MAASRSNVELMLKLVTHVFRKIRALVVDRGFGSCCANVNEVLAGCLADLLGTPRSITVAMPGGGRTAKVRYARPLKAIWLQRTYTFTVAVPAGASKSAFQVSCTECRLVQRKPGRHCNRRPNDWYTDQAG